MPTIQDILFGLGLPALIGAILFLLNRRETSVPGSADIRPRSDVSAATPFILGFAFLLAYPAILQRMPRLPPKEADDWLYLAVLGLVILSAVYQFLWRNWWFWQSSTFTIIGLSVAICTWLIAKNGWSIWETLGTIAAAWASVMVFVSVLGAACKSDSRISLAFVVAAVTALSAAVLAMSGCQTYGQLAATLPAALFPIVLVSIPTRTRIISEDCLPVLAIIFGTTLLCGKLYVDPGLRLPNLLLLFFAPLGFLVGDLPVIRRQKLWVRNLFRIISTLAPAGVAFVLTLRQFLADMSNEWSGY